MVNKTDPILIHFPKRIGNRLRKKAFIERKSITSIVIDAVTKVLRYKKK